MCDSPACSRVEIIVRKARPERIAIARAIKADLAPLGIEVRLQIVNDDVFFGIGPQSRVPLFLAEFQRDYPSGSITTPEVLAGANIGPGKCCNLTMVGASPQVLRRYGYEVTSVPSLDDRIDACAPRSFDAATQCWTELDQYAMTQVAPAVPLVFATQASIVSSRVLRFRVDQGATQFPMPALDQVALTPGARTATLPPLPVPSAVPTTLPAIPDGTYELTVTPKDLVRAGADPNDEGGLLENSGTTRFTLSNGRWRSIITSDKFIFHPIGTGVFYGSGDQVTFVTELPPDNVLSWTVRWQLEGGALRFKVVNVDIKDALPDVKAMFEAHPWKKVA